MIGGNILVDTESGFFRDTNRQVDRRRLVVFTCVHQISEVCEMMAEDPLLQVTSVCYSTPTSPGWLQCHRLLSGRPVPQGSRPEVGPQ